jgi:hypothetical protein
MSDPTTAAMPQIDQLVAKYIQLRDKQAERKKKYDADKEVLDKAKAKIEQYFLSVMNQQGLTSLPTDAGTPYRTTKTSVSVADPVSYMAWLMAEPDRLAVGLDIKANKTFVVAFKEEHNDLPPGLNWHEEVAVNVRR